MKTITWSAIYQAQANGRFKISRAGLIEFEKKHPDRILDTSLWGRPAKVLLFDVPLKLGGRIRDSKLPELELRPIRLHELPGWPPKMASAANSRTLPALMDCRLRDASFSAGPRPGQEALELRLVHNGKNYTAWQTGCPLPLLKCAEATLNQGGVVGRDLSDIQDVNLVSGE